MADFTVRDEGTIILLFPATEAAEEWAAEHISDEALTWAAAIVVEPRYIGDILVGIKADGLTVELGGKMIEEMMARLGAFESNDPASVSYSGYCFGVCGLCGIRHTHGGGGYCGHGPYWTGDPYCRKCYATGDNCSHSPEERAEFDRG